MDKEKKVMKLNMASFIDHTLLKPDASGEQIDQLCREAAENHFYAVCVNPYWVKRAHHNLQGTKVKVATVVGFPLGATTSRMKALETKLSVEDGADEIDMVINIGALKSGETEIVLQDIQGVIQAAHGRIVKVILETGLLKKDEIIEACLISKEAGAHFVKTSTGFIAGGATIEDVELMRNTVGPDMGVKASGGIRDRQQAMAMIQAGATRLGTSSGLKLL